MRPKTRILMGVTGGIAAYKSPDLVRRLIERGADVQVVMTASARKFITPMSLQAVSGRPVRADLWDSSAEAAMGHIELARWAEIVGDYLARRTEPVSLSRGVLAIRLREDEARRVVKGLLPEMSKKASAACPPVRSVVLVQK